MISLDKIPVPNYKEKPKKTKTKKKITIVKYVDKIVSNEYLKEHYLEKGTKKKH